MRLLSTRSTPRRDQPSASAALAGPGTDLPYLEPDELLAPLRATMLPPDWEVVSTPGWRDVSVERIRFRTEVLGGKEIFMAAHLCRPDVTGDLPPLLMIPGGGGRVPTDVAAYHARETGAVVLCVDWAGVGDSTDIGQSPPAEFAFRYDGHDYTTSYQYHQLRALLHAKEILLAQPGIRPAALGVMGSSWGGYYSLLLAGLDPAIAHIQATYGCGFLELGCHQIWSSHMATMDAEDVESWRQAFDAGRRAHLIRGDLFYLQATNDRYFSLPGAMRTYHRVRSPKRLLFAWNQDHSAHPYHRLALQVTKRQLAGELAEAAPAVQAHWNPGEATVEVEPAEGFSVEDVEVVYSAGSYAPWAARRWRSVPARRTGGRWIAEIPVVDPARELWFYGLVRAKGGWAGSSDVQTVVPGEAGLASPTAAFTPRFDFSGAEWWDQPIGDVGDPAQKPLEDGPGLSIRFGTGRHLRGVVYCVEGDMIARDRYDGIEATIRVPDPAHVDGLMFGVFTDYATFEEQAYAVDVSTLAPDLTSWTTVRIAFADLDWHPHRFYDFATPPAAPLDMSRICAVGFLRPTEEWQGEAHIRDVELIRLGDQRSAQRVQSVDYELHIDTALEPDVLRERLRRWVPWRHEIVFGNGVRTSELERGPMYSARPLQKWHQFAQAIPAEDLQGRRALDVGSNVGHYSLFLSSTFGMSTVGLETNPRNLEVARFLAEVAGDDRVQFLDADASSWRGEEGFALVLHLGTLDHLLHPFLALTNAFEMLDPDGYLALELQVLVHPDDEFLCRFVPASDPATTCRWYLGRAALLEMLAEAGFDRVEILLDWRRPELIGENMARLAVLARKPSVA